MVSFVGPSGSGKTTVITALIRELTRRGFRVAAIKHSRASFQIDQKGKDSARLREAGARAVLLLSPSSLSLIAGRHAGLTPRDAARLFLPGVDFILVEGWREAALPKVVVSSRLPARPARANVIARIAARGTAGAIPLFAPSDSAALADLLLSLSCPS